MVHTIQYVRLFRYLNLITKKSSKNQQPPGGFQEAREKMHCIHRKIQVGSSLISTDSAKDIAVEQLIHTTRNTLYV